MSRSRRAHRRPAGPAAPAGIIGIIVLALILILARAPGDLTDMFGRGSSAADLCDEAISWKEAWGRSGELQGRIHAVKGPVAGASYVTDIDGRPTFINIGAEHPETPRFEAIIWDRNRGAFLDVFPEGPERMLSERSACVAGKITIHEGVPQIELKNPAQILIE